MGTSNKKRKNVSMLQPDKDLENIFEHTVQVASVNDHEYITLEHFLYCLVVNPSFKEVLTKFGTDTASLTTDLEDFISKELQDIVNPELEKPKKTSTVDRVLNRAFTQVLFSGRQLIEPADCFISIFQEKKSYAYYYLKKHNVDKEEFLAYIQKAVDLLKQKQ